MRIVSLAPNATSILCALGARSSLVGVTRWCRDVAPVKHLPQFGDCWKLESVPQILKLRPDLVIGSVPFKTETLGKLLEHPVRFLALNPRTLADIESDIRVVAGLVGRNSAATRVIAKMRKKFAAICATSHGKRKLRVYCEAWPNPRISSPLWVSELVEICGGEFVPSPGARVSDDEVAKANPEVIILAWAATGDRAKPEKSYAVEKWSDLPAILNRHVFVVRDELLNTPAPILARGARELAKILLECRSRLRNRS
ncbi:MAG TPA: ABC transporter substrate-binding protein [Candidatus Dormibacteraeota bacterium]|jgi:iron complex transport system substrate-binding protein|nr:ABC transporter substrate-binding protein [Candidatus Dormibacteraeota bacterium]